MPKALILLLLFTSFLSYGQEVVVNFQYPEKVKGFQDLTPLFTHERELIFSATDFTHKGYWVTDGSEQGTRKITFDSNENVIFERTSIFKFGTVTTAFSQGDDRLFFLKGDSFKPYLDSTFFVNSVFQAGGHTFVISYEHKKPPIDNRGLRLGSLYKIVGTDSLSLISSDLSKYDSGLSNFIINEHGVLYKEASGNFFFHDGEKKLQLDFLSENLKETPYEFKVYSGFLYVLTKVHTSSEEILKFDLKNGKYQRTVVSPIGDSIKTAFITSNLSFFAAAKTYNGFSFVDMHNESILFSIRDNVLNGIKIANSSETSKIISFQHIENSRLYFVLAGSADNYSYFDRIQIGFYDFDQGEYKVSQELKKQTPIRAHRPRETMKLQVESSGVSLFSGDYVYTIDKELNGEIIQKAKASIDNFPVELTNLRIENETEWNSFSAKISDDREFAIYNGGVDFFNSGKVGENFFGFNNRNAEGFGVYNSKLKSYVEKDSSGSINSWSKLRSEHSIFYGVRNFNSFFESTSFLGYIRGLSDDSTSKIETYKEPAFGQNSIESWISFDNEFGERQTTFLSTEKESRPVLTNVDIYQTKSRTFAHHKDASKYEQYSVSEIQGSEVVLIKENVTQIITSDLNVCFLANIDSVSSTIDCLVGGGESVNVAEGIVSLPRFLSDKHLEYYDENTNAHSVVDLTQNQNILQGSINRPLKAFSFLGKEYLVFWDKVVKIEDGQMLEILTIEAGYFSGTMKLVGNSIILVVRDHGPNDFDPKDIVRFDLVEEELEVLSHGKLKSFLDETPFDYYYWGDSEGGQVYFWNKEEEILESKQIDFGNNPRADKTTLVFRDGFYTSSRNLLLVWDENGFQADPIEFGGFAMFAVNEGARTSVFSYTFDRDNLIILNQILSDGTTKLVSRIPKEDRMNYREIFFENGEAFAYIFTKEAGWQVWKLGDYEIEPLPKSLVILASDESHQDLEIQVYPNPTAGFIQLTSQEPSEVFVSNAKGQKMGVYTLRKNHKIDFSTYKPGTYFLKAVMGDNVISKKVIKY